MEERRNRRYRRNHSGPRQRWAGERLWIYQIPQGLQSKNDCSVSTLNAQENDDNKQVVWLDSV